MPNFLFFLDDHNHINIGWMLLNKGSTGWEGEPNSHHGQTILVYQSPCLILDISPSHVFRQLTKKWTRPQDICQLPQRFLHWKTGTALCTCASPSLRLCLHYGLFRTPPIKNKYVSPAFAPKVFRVAYNLATKEIKENNDCIYFCSFSPSLYFAEHKTLN